ncbi:MAG: hypothetical protein KAI74_00635 [Kiritimatiellae bacterium]|nr:hypothetical protein [Kiritimatiellia bacterium]
MKNETENSAGTELAINPNKSLQINDSLPVLSAFNDFIKAEQRIARNRMLVIGGLFTTIMVVIIGAGIIIGTVFYHQLHSDLRQTKSELNEYHIKTEIEKSASKERISKIQNLAANIASNMEKQEKELLAARKSMSLSQGRYKKELYDMKQLIDTLSLENRGLKQGGTQIYTETPAITTQIKNPYARQPVKKPKITRQSYQKVAKTADNSSLRINLQSSRDNSAVMLLLPIPE